MRVEIPVDLLEFDEGGHTIWVQSEAGTVLRIKCSGRIVVEESCQNNVAHADLLVKGDIKICVPDDG